MSKDHQNDIVDSVIRSSDHWVYGFSQIDNGVIDHEELDIYDKMVYIAIKRMINQQDQITFPSYEKIGQKAGCSRRKAIDVVKRLIEFDLIRNVGQHSQYGSNVYMIQKVQESSVLADPEKNKESVIQKVGDIKQPKKQEKKKKTEDDPTPYKEIMDHLNATAGTKFSHKGSANQKLIKARWNEGFRLDDFKAVIEIKSAQWKDSDMAQYLRPSTLFGNKFDQYRNENPDWKPNIQSGQASENERFKKFLEGDE